MKLHKPSHTEKRKSYHHPLFGNHHFEKKVNKKRELPKVTNNTCV